MWTRTLCWEGKGLKLLNNFSKRQGFSSSGKWWWWEFENLTGRGWGGDSWPSEENLKKSDFDHSKWTLCVVSMVDTSQSGRLVTLCHMFSNPKRRIHHFLFICNLLVMKLVHQGFFATNLFNPPIDQKNWRHNKEVQYFDFNFSFSNMIGCSFSFEDGGEQTRQKTCLNITVSC